MSRKYKNLMSMEYDSLSEMGGAPPTGGGGTTASGGTANMQSFFNQPVSGNGAPMVQHPGYLKHQGSVHQQHHQLMPQ